MMIIMIMISVVCLMNYFISNTKKCLKILLHTFDIYEPWDFLGPESFILLVLDLLFIV